MVLRGDGAVSGGAALAVGREEAPAATVRVAEVVGPGERRSGECMSACLAEHRFGGFGRCAWRSALAVVARTSAFYSSVHRRLAF